MNQTRFDITRRQALSGLGATSALALTGCATTGRTGAVTQAQSVGLERLLEIVLSPASKLRANVLEVLQREGYIRGYSEDSSGKHPALRIELKYFEGEPAIKHVARVSKPGRRVYSGSKELPIVRNGLGITIVSTPKGVLSDAEARTENVGGEVLAEVF